jgi:hypothetical protein
MRTVLERCPRCGVEHDTSADSICEACDTPLRAWCRAHSREIGWLEGPGCHRCAEEAAPAATRTRASAPALPCPDFSAAAAGAASPRPSVAGEAPVETLGVPRKPLDPVEHLFIMLLMMLMATGGGTLLSVLAGFVYVLSGRGTLPDTPLRFAIAGAVLGLLSGGVSCAKYLRSLRTAARAS